MGGFFLKKKSSGRRPSKSVSAKRGNTTTNGSGRKYELIGLILLSFALISGIGLLGLNVGFVGFFFADIFRYLFGLGAFFAILIVLLISTQYITHHRGVQYTKKFFGVISLFISLLAIWHHFVIPVGEEILPQSLSEGGGLLGGGVLFVLRTLFGVDGAVILLGTFVVGSILLSTTWSLASGYMKTREQAKKSAQAAGAALHTTRETIGTVAEKFEQRTTQMVHQMTDTMPYNQEKDPLFVEQHSQMEDPKHHPDDTEAKIQDSVSADLEIHTPIAEEEPVPVASPMESMVAEQETSSGAHLTTLKQEHENTPIQFSIQKSEEHLPEKIPSAPHEQVVDALKIAEDKIEETDETISDAEEQDPSDEEVRQDDTEEATAMRSEQISSPDAETAGKAAYILPKVTHILSKHVKKENGSLDQEIEENAHTLQQTLESFHVNAKVISACHGPAVTRYDLEPAPGVKVSKITNLAEDIALQLATTSVRIEPVPGKAAIGIEIPNRILESVQLRDVLENPAFQEAKSKLTVGLGMDISGQAIFADIGKMPHLLVAGATGSGKSVCINTLISSILFKAAPDEVKFILIDPKMVELSNYNGIPHLMVPVVTDPKKASSVLNWAVQEMEKRYAVFASHSVRDIKSFNRRYVEEKMPFIVIVIDELADLMMVSPRDVEDSICRILQKARAAGIHMILATQRPSVNVITGIIKANLPSRISFAVSSQVDSRTILDRGGAETLLGKGDMLFSPQGAPKPIRVQGAFISDEEVEMLLDYIRSQGQEVSENEELIDFIENDSKEDDSSEEDEFLVKQDKLLPDAVELVMSTGQASSSSIQRRFRVGYSRAARLVDTMEELRIIGPSGGGNKPREILMSQEQAMELVKSLM
ncbi:DNA translocase FtsK [Selenomonas sp.]|uniref:FtsK/SpoIIIE family DNA translocase n=1 Tax=Selenomonas sp. TaxID=2053611 RepID=UPI001CB0666A|nr:DNA translocase FtsK [Selenomonas sp.]MBF1692893.1 DNA translocase FtsK [Selenomonas sp.]